MAHYAELGVDNIVKRVLYIDTIKCMTNGGIEKEEIGREYLETQHGGTWIKCSFNTYGNVHNEGGTPFRANYPGQGDYYNSTYDIFHAPRPTDMNGQSCISWTLNTTTGLWTPPITKPTYTNDPSVDEVPHYYEWDESAYQADNTKGWVDNSAAYTS